MSLWLIYSASDPKARGSRLVITDWEKLSENPKTELVLSSKSETRCNPFSPLKLGSSSERETVVAVLDGGGGGQTGVRDEMEDRMDEATEDADMLEEYAESEAETEETSESGEMTMSA